MIGSASSGTTSSGLTTVIERVDLGPLMVGSYRCDARSAYFDLQEFIEDSLFEFIDKLCHFDIDSYPALQDFTLQRQLHPDVIDYGRKLLRMIDANTFTGALDLPYLYTFFAPDFRVFIFDNGQAYLAVFVTAKKN